MSLTMVTLLEKIRKESEIGNITMFSDNFPHIILSLEFIYLPAIVE